MSHDLALTAAAIAGLSTLVAVVLQFMVFKRKRDLLDRQYSLGYLHSLISAHAAHLDEAFLLTIFDKNRVEKVKQKLKSEWIGKNLSPEFAQTLVVQTKAIVEADQRELVLLESLCFFALTVGGIVLSIAFGLRG